MIKSLIAGIWAVALLSGSLYFFSGMENPGSNEGAELQVKPEHIKLETMSITIVRDNTLQGYLILDTSFEYNSARQTKSLVPVELALMDSINTIVFSDIEFDMNNLDQFDFVEFKSKVMLAINDKHGDGFVQDMLIKRIDFISYDEIREKKLRGG